MRVGLRGVVFTVLVCLVAVASAAEAQVSVSGNISKFAFKNVNNIVSTTSTTLVQLPQSTVTFTQSTPGAVTIVFCGEISRTGAGDRVFLQARVDSTVASPPIVALGSSDFSTDSRRSHCFTFALDGVAAGAHTVRLRWATAAGNQMNAERRTLTVYHN